VALVVRTLFLRASLATNGSGLFARCGSTALAGGPTALCSYEKVSAEMGCRIGFIGARFAGTDGVSLESAKWAEVLWHHRHVSYWYGGKLDRSPDISLQVPQAHFGHPTLSGSTIVSSAWGREVPK